MENYGIVLWADSPSGGLIIWCEDSGELAFAGSEVASSAHDCGVGDLVELAFERAGPGERVCSQVVRKRKNAAPELVQMLKQQAQEALVEPQTWPAAAANTPGAPRPDLVSRE